MKTFLDADGVQFQAYQLEGPTCLNTYFGELCGEGGMWVAYLPQHKGWPVLIEASQFQFIPVE